MIENYVIHILIMMGIYAILAVSLNFSLGFTGLLNMGHIAFFGIGAYTSALLVKAGVPFIIAIIVAGLIAGIFGFLLMLATKRLKGDYLALATLGFSYVIMSVMLNWTSVTRGPLGIPGIPKPNIFGLVIKSNLSYLILVGIIAGATIGMMWAITKSPFGRLMQATRDDALALRSLGKNTFKIKYKTMMISAFFAGIAGSLFAHYITFIDPSSFALNEVILIFTIVIIGGIASVKGSLLGTFIIILIPELIRFISIPSSMIGPIRQMIYAGILIAILIIRPRGIFGRIDLE